MRILKPLLILLTLIMFNSCTESESNTITSEKVAFNVDFLLKNDNFSAIYESLNNNQKEFKTNSKDLLFSFNKQVIKETNFSDLNNNERKAVFSNFYKNSKNFSTNECLNTAKTDFFIGNLIASTNVNVKTLFNIISNNYAAHIISCTQSDNKEGGSGSGYEDGDDYDDDYGDDGDGNPDTPPYPSDDDDDDDDHSGDPGQTSGNHVPGTTGDSGDSGE